MNVGVYPSGPRHGLSLCAGGGGLDLGLMLAEPDFHTRCFVEWEEYPRQAIIAGQRAGYFAPAPIWDDLRTFDARPWAGRIDTLLAGYPCQPFSAAGKRLGEDDERHLWPEVARCARELGDGLEWIFLENVAGHVSLGLETVLRELWDMGFTPAAGLFSAGETGAPHERLRIFIVAHRVLADPGNARSSRAGSRSQSCGEIVQLGDDCREEIGVGHASGIGRREWWPEPIIRGRRDAAACASGAMADAGGRRPDGSATWQDQQPGRTEAVSTGAAMADTGGAELEGIERGQHHPGRWQIPDGYPALQGGTGLHPPGPGDLAGWAAVLASRPDLAPAVSLRDVKRAADHFAALVARGIMAESEAESIVCRMAASLSNRSRALRLLGNAVHPLAAGHAWRSLASAHGLGPVDLGAE